MQKRTSRLQTVNSAHRHRTRDFSALLHFHFLSAVRSLVPLSIQRCSSAQGLEFPWPEEVTQAMDGVFELMKIMYRSQPRAVLACRNLVVASEIG